MKTVAPHSSPAIQAAVNACLARCYASDPPIAALAEYLDELRGQGWDEPDILSVEITVRRVLAKVLDSKISDDDVS